MKHRIILAAAAFFILLGIRNVQAKDYPNWDGQPPFFAMNDVIEFKGAVYGASKGGIFRYDPETGDYTLFYKDNGLPANEALCVAATSDYLYFGFETSGIMRFDPATDRFEKILFPEYIPNNIAVRSICAKNDSILYVGHSEGVDMLNLSTEEVRTYTRLGDLAENTPVNDVELIKGEIWVCTPSGIAVADEENPNLELESNWTNHYYYYGSSVKSVEFYSIIRLEDSVEDTIFIGTKNYGIVYYDELKGRCYETVITSGSVYKFTKAMGKYWAVSTQGLLRKYARIWLVDNTDYTDMNCLAGTDERLWGGSLGSGLQSYTDSGYVEVNPVPGSKSSTITKIDIGDDNSVWTTSAVNDQLGIVQCFRDGVWTVYGKNGKTTTFCPTAVKLDTGGNLWVSIWGDYSSGIYIIPKDGGTVAPQRAMISFDSKKTIIKPTITKNYVVCTDLTRDSDGNMWAANLQLDQPDTEAGGQSHNIEDVPSSGAVLIDGYPATRYRHFSPASGDIPTAKISRICVDRDGWVWMGTSTKGLMAVNYGDDPYDTSFTTVKKQFKVEDGLLSLKITALDYDEDGYVWVGTDAGLCRVTKLTGYQLKIDTMNQLLDTAGTDIYSIEVDHLNNKWIGTSNGLVKISSDNETEEVYTTENSGLFSNFIYSLRYDNANDVLWIGTDAGLNTFKTLGSNTNSETPVARVYPNPFSIWGTNSLCTFDNLKQGSTVRIFTFNGTPIHELQVTDISSNGISRVTWDGRNYKNEFVASGVYFFTGEDTSGLRFRDKMVVIRR